MTNVKISELIEQCNANNSRLKEDWEKNFEPVIFQMMVLNQLTFMASMLAEIASRLPES